MKKRNRRLLAVLCAVVTAAGIAAPAMTPVYAAQNEVTNEEVNAEVMSAGNTKDDVDDSGNADEQEDVYSLKYITVDGRTAWYYANEKGEVDKDYIGVTDNDYGWWYVKHGEVDFSYTGLGFNDAGCWRIVDGAVDFGCTSVVDSEYGWWYVRDGHVDYSYTGIAPNEYGWWRIVNGQVDFTCNSVESNEYGWFYLRNGQVDFGYTGVIEGKKGSRSYQYYFINGKANENLTGVFYTKVNGAEGWYGFYKGELATSDDYYEAPGRVLSNVSGWWYINPKTGLVDFNYNGLGITEDDDWYHYWYVENGQINFNFNGLYNYHTRYYGDILCCITNGQVDPNVNGVYQLTVNGQTNWYGFFQGMQTEDEVLMNPYDGSWWYTGDDGLVDFSYTGIAERYDQNGDKFDSWYVRNGQVDFSSNGWVKINNHYVYVRNGMLQSDLNGLVQATIDGKDGWWEVDHGTLFDNTNYYYTLCYYGGSWWAVYNSQVDFSYTGFVEHDGTRWYVENGRVNFDKTGFVNTEEADTYAYVQNGQYNKTFYGAIYAELNGKNSWWQVKDGNCVHSANAAWNGKPDSFAANENGLWAIVNGEVAFDVTGEYSYGTYYSVSGEDSIYVSYIYQVENGLVTSMQATVLDR